MDPAIAANASNVRRLVYCSGKIYYELAEERAKRCITDIAIVRVEQLAPFPWDHVAKEAEQVHACTAPHITTHTLVHVTHTYH